jgi:uridine kinase
MKKEIEIIVQGKIGSGKSTIASDLYEELKYKGFKNVILKDDLRVESCNQTLRMKTLVWDPDFHITIQTREVQGGYLNAVHYTY